MKKYNFSIDEFYKKFNETYDFLYDNRDCVAGFSEAVKAGDKFINKEENHKFIGEFNSYRGDFLTSDREVAAFMFTLSDFIDREDEAK